MRSNTKQIESAAIEEVAAVYADLQGRSFARNCTLVSGCCNFGQTGKVPHLTRGEALMVLKGLKASGRKSVPKRTDGACPFLAPESSRCLIYQFRPFGCRTHYCKAAGGPVPRADVLDLIRRLEQIDAKFGGDGPRALTAIVG